MSRRTEVLRRIATIQAELAQLMQLLADDPVFDAESAAAPAPARTEPAAPAAEAELPPEPEPPKKKRRWSYLDGQRYRIIGNNPFRNGNNFSIFEGLQEQFGGSPFRREDIRTLFNDLQASGKLTTDMQEHQHTVQFLSIAGVQKGQIEMVRD